MSYTYASFVTALSTEAVISQANTDFQAILPTIIDQAEQRIYRDLNLINTIVRDSSASTTALTRAFSLPSEKGLFVVVQSINILNGTDRTALTKISREAMDSIWPSEAAVSGLTIPMNYAPLTDSVYLLGPATSTPNIVEVIGTIRPTPLSASNTTTYLSANLPDLLLAAGMSAMSAYMRNFGSQADDPKMAMSWEADYASRIKSANIEEKQRKYQAFSSTGGM